MCTPPKQLPSGRVGLPIHCSFSHSLPLAPPPAGRPAPHPVRTSLPRIHPRCHATTPTHNPTFHPNPPAVSSCVAAPMRPRLLPGLILLLLPNGALGGYTITVGSDWYPSEVRA